MGQSQNTDSVLSKSTNSFINLLDICNCCSQSDVSTSAPANAVCFPKEMICVPIGSSSSCLIEVS